MWKCQHICFKLAIIEGSIEESLIRFGHLNWFPWPPHHCFFFMFWYQTLATSNNNCTIVTPKLLYPAIVTSNLSLCLATLSQSTKYFCSWNQLVGSSLHCDQQINDVIWYTRRRNVNTHRITLMLIFCHLWISVTYFILTYHCHQSPNE